VESELYVGEQKIRFDRHATAALYRDTITTPGADRCTCVSCKNFAAQRGTIFPKDFLQFLNQLGIDPLKEWEAFDYDFGPEISPSHLYGGWFLFSGELVAGQDKTPERSPQQAFGHWFTSSFPTGTLPKDVKLCAVEFLAQVPWVLPETL
jgi:hypothetical protein